MSIENGQIVKAATKQAGAKPVCPYLNKPHARCGEQWTLRNLTAAVAYCANRYTACPIYQDAIAHERKVDQPKGPAGILTAP
jgi:hypothetical protein